MYIHNLQSSQQQENPNLLKYSQVYLIENNAVNGKKWFNLRKIYTI